MQKTLHEKLVQFKCLDGDRFIDDELYILHPAIVQVYIQSGRYSFPCHIFGIYAELYINGSSRAVFIENGLALRADFKVGTIDEHGYFHYTAEETRKEKQAA